MLEAQLSQLRLIRFPHTTDVSLDRSVSSQVFLVSFIYGHREYAQRNNTAAGLEQPSFPSNLYTIDGEDWDWILLH